VELVGGSVAEETDGSTEGTRTRNAMEHMQLKIARTKELIKSEQTARDGKRSAHASHDPQSEDMTYTEHCNG